jgi:hypothetical protein
MITTSMAHSISQTLWVTDHPSLIPRWHNLLSMLFALTCSNVLLHNMLGTAVEIDTGLAPDQIVTNIEIRVKECGPTTCWRTALMNALGILKTQNRLNSQS